MKDKDKSDAAETLGEASSNSAASNGAATDTKATTTTCTATNGESSTTCTMRTGESSSSSKSSAIKSGDTDDTPPVHNTHGRRTKLLRTCTGRQSNRHHQRQDVAKYMRLSRGHYQPTAPSIAAEAAEAAAVAKRKQVTFAVARSENTLCGKRSGSGNGGASRTRLMLPPGICQRQELSLEQAMELCGDARILTLASEPYSILHINASYTRLTGVHSHMIMGQPIDTIFYSNPTPSSAAGPSSSLWSSSSSASASATTSTSSLSGQSSLTSSTQRRSILSKRLLTQVRDTVVDVRTRERYGCSVGDTREQGTYAPEAGAMRCHLTIFPVVCHVNCVTSSSSSSGEDISKAAGDDNNDDEETQYQRTYTTYNEQEEYLKQGKKLTHYLLQLTSCQMPPYKRSLAQRADSAGSVYNSDNDSTIGDGGGGGGGHDRRKKKKKKRRRKSSGKYELAIG